MELQNGEGLMEDSDLREIVEHDLRMNISADSGIRDAAAIAGLIAQTHGLDNVDVEKLSGIVKSEAAKLGLTIL
jgi:hypothetical protein